jgi:hypothetical protein
MPRYPRPFSQAMEVLTAIISQTGGGVVMRSSCEPKSPPFLGSTTDPRRLREMPPQATTNADSWASLPTDCLPAVASIFLSSSALSRERRRKAAVAIGATSDVIQFSPHQEGNGAASTSRPTAWGWKAWCRSGRTRLTAAAAPTPSRRRSASRSRCTRLPACCARPAGQRWPTW